MVIEESFEEAQQHLLEWLRQEEKPDRLVWIFREDLVDIRGKFFVHPSPPEKNQGLARQLYGVGVKQERGLRLRVIGYAESYAYGYVSVPPDDIAANYGMICGLHYTIPGESSKTRRGKRFNRARHPLHFSLLRLYSRIRGESWFIKEVPQRRDQQVVA